MAQPTLAPQFANLQARLGDLVAPPPVGPPGAPILAAVPIPSPVVGGGGGVEDSWSILSSPWLWVGLAVLILVGLFLWWNSQKKKDD